MSYYSERKEHARQEAKAWPEYEKDAFLSRNDLREAAEYFTKTARRYGLLREFRKSGII